MLLWSSWSFLSCLIHSPSLSFFFLLFSLYFARQTAPLTLTVYKRQTHKKRTKRKKKNQAKEDSFTSTSLVYKWMIWLLPSFLSLSSLLFSLSLSVASVDWSVSLPSPSFFLCPPAFPYVAEVSLLLSFSSFPFFFIREGERDQTILLVSVLLVYPLLLSSSRINGSRFWSLLPFIWVWVFLLFWSFCLSLLFSFILIHELFSLP